jgi:O-antigen/teichoic acid export membrane protein
MIAATYAPIFQMGVLNGLNRDLPFLSGAGKREEGITLVSSAQAFALGLALLSMILTAFLVIYLYVIRKAGIDLLLGVTGVGIIISLRFVQNFLSVTFRANQAFRQLANAYFIHFFVLIALLPVVYYFKYKGLVYYYILINFALTILMFLVRPFRVRSIINTIAIRKLISTGLPIYIISYLQQVSKSFGKIILLWLGGPVSVGLFSPALAIQSSMIILPKILAQYFYPKMSYSYGKYRNKIMLWSWVWKISVLIILGSVVLIVPGWILLPHIIEYFFPKYMDGLQAARWALLAGCFAGAMVSSNVLGSIKDYKAWGIITGIKLILNFTFPLLMTRFMDLLEGVALGIFISDLLLLILSLTIIRKVLHKPDE